MLTLRLSIFALSCLALIGNQLYLATFACLLAAIVLWGYAISAKMLLAYCRVAATVIWTVSTVAFIHSGAPLILIFLLFVMIIVDGFHPHRA